MFGASVSQIVAMLSTSFLKWVLIADIIAWPCAYYLARLFLQNFSYRVHLGADVFIVTTLATMLFALATVTYQAVHAAKANPVEALRYE
jgi:putative ABC transport system permease protein